MKVVALVEAPPDMQAAAVALASVMGMAPAEARMRLAPEPPALLARLAPEAAEALVEKLRGLGLSVLAVDERGLGADWLMARRVTLGDASAVFTSRAGESLELPWSDVVAVLRAASSVRTRSEHKEAPSKLDTAKAYGLAIASHGLLLPRTGPKTVKQETEETSQVIYVFSRDGRSALLGEHGMDFSCLGAEMQPSRIANMTKLMGMLCVRAPGAFHDERLLRLGRRPLPFVVGDSTQLSAGDVSVRRVSTVQGMDVLAEVMRQAVLQGLLE
ncbi:hypothetical protein MYSTI_06120 [Myxococcus stipitatus DSM 14675]|uniref:Uncharacterized protein n=1 Tax=Myxococcus stipitatus (strain DSM 14675 / JCM 12634 / Mx s8) TaxID=1278073 RepID=L7UHB3_MYXSD|nr:hypothetical protein [Myxococcus stipitatus]AGC47393.1 hypothetical protein MYSTI_06120 [Myxococcus stipitatus DSM 14675]